MLYTVLKITMCNTYLDYMKYTWNPNTHQEVVENQDDNYGSYRKRSGSRNGGKEKGREEVTGGGWGEREGSCIIQHMSRSLSLMMELILSSQFSLASSLFSPSLFFTSILFSLSLSFLFSNLTRTIVGEIRYGQRSEEHQLKFRVVV